MINSRFIALALAAGLAFGCSKEPVAIAKTTYNAALQSSCAAAERPGLAGIHDDEISENGIRFSVRTPVNYDSTIPHPLLLVYPGAGQSRFATERFTGFTFGATAAGFIVAYPDHRSLSLKTLDEFATIPVSIAAKWCIDGERIYLTGHSDGGTAASAIAFREDDGFSPSAIAPSAAGLSASHLEEIDCPAPLPVMVLHNSGDRLFPDFGAQAASWWAACNRCDPGSRQQLSETCFEYAKCPQNASVRYCEESGGHRKWPAKNDEVLNFFSTIQKGSTADKNVAPST